MKERIYEYAAFDQDGVGGNPAGIALDADDLSESEMLKIARQLGYSETAFVMKSDKADFKVRFFTGEGEVDLCGHATIATFNCLRDLGLIKEGHYTQETLAGILAIEVLSDKVLMEQTLPVFYDTLKPEVILPCYDALTLELIDTNYPIQMISTGLKDIIVPVKSLEALENMVPNDEAIAKLSQEHQAVGIHAFCKIEEGIYQARVRNFAPLYGIKEESATGTSNGALGAYLMTYMDHVQEGNYLFEQGVEMGEPSSIIVKISKKEDKIHKVIVGGSARRFTRQ